MAPNPAARKALGIAGLAGLAIAAVGLAAPGPEAVPAAVEGGPGWLLGLYGNGLGIGPGLYYGLLWLAFVAYLCVLLAAPAIDRRLLLWSSLALIAAFALAPPLLSQDVFSYIDYSRLDALHGLNPYVDLPVDAAGDPAFRYVGWTDSPSAYGPLFTLVAYPLGWMSVPAALWTLKAIAAASVFVLALLVARMASSRGASPGRAFALVALNPLVLVHVVGGAHNDATTMLIAMAGCAAVLAMREGSGGFALVSAAALKISSAFVLPFALLGARGKPDGARQFLGGGLAALVAIGLLSSALWGWHWIEALGVAGENQGRVSNYSLPNLISELLRTDVDAIRVLALGLYLVLLGALGWWVWHGADWVRASGWAALGLLLASAWLLPWYIVWALPFAALSRDGRLISLVLALTALQLAARVPL